MVFPVAPEVLDWIELRRIGGQKLDLESQERLIALTTELKKALLQKLFTEGLRDERQKQTQIGPVPESWGVVELGNLATKISK